MTNRHAPALTPSSCSAMRVRAVRIRLEMSGALGGHQHREWHTDPVGGNAGKRLGAIGGTPSGTDGSGQRRSAATLLARAAIAERVAIGRQTAVETDCGGGLGDHLLIGAISSGAEVSADIRFASAVPLAGGRRCRPRVSNCRAAPSADRATRQHNGMARRIPGWTYCRLTRGWAWAWAWAWRDTGRCMRSMFRMARRLTSARPIRGSAQGESSLNAWAERSRYRGGRRLRGRIVGQCVAAEPVDVVKEVPPAGWVSTPTSRSSPKARDRSRDGSRSGRRATASAPAGRSGPGCPAGLRQSQQVASPAAAPRCAA